MPFDRPFDKPFDKPLDKPFDKLTVLSKVEGLTVLSNVEGLSCLRSLLPPGRRPSGPEALRRITPYAVVAPRRPRFWRDFAGLN
jgi:hypothetical protein